MARARVWLVLAGAILAPASARAQDFSDTPPAQDDSALLSGIEQRRAYWYGSGPVRPFLAAALNVGIVYYRPKLQIGYGRPHYAWFGAEGGAGVGLAGGRFYASLRAQYPYIDARVGARYEFSFEQRFLLPQDAYTREDTESAKLGKLRYVSGEAEVAGSCPFPGGSLVGLVGGYYLTAGPEDAFIFEEALKQIVEPPWVWRARLGYLAHIGWLGSMKIGPAAELIHVPLREAITVRVGPAISVALTHHLEASGTLMIVAASRDDLGLAGADLGQLSLSYKWATGDRFAEFP
jgi:hypothetical protein